MKKTVLHILYFILVSAPLLGQQIITGKVVDDETKRPIKDAEVLIEGTNTASKTNLGGYFQLAADTSNILIISSADYEIATMKVPTGLNKFQVSLKRRTLNDSSIFIIVEQQPEFPDGISGLYKYINKNLKYPRDARKTGVDGKVLIEFIVERDGSIAAVKVQKSLTPSCDEEAIRLIKEMPKWSPGMQNQKPVRCKFLLPITFRP